LRLRLLSDPVSLEYDHNIAQLPIFYCIINLASDMAHPVRL